MQDRILGSTRNGPVLQNEKRARCWEREAKAAKLQVPASTPSALRRPSKISEPLATRLHVAIVA
ncbi:hypothetical protein CGMCC3_g2400 [Colletotrichum fructicola]|nr:uncharacterized protein CGMCC3_g2400 [Colletotrichum fructicola]KAE9581828.1 hypothetical protein CGMCC3_g2400 [Colletotrichum fructicola]